MSLADWTEGGAEFDNALAYRHHLWRARPTGLISAGAERRLGVCMHNPSKAGAVPTDNDPTVKKLIGFADRWGFNRLDVANMGDLIATDPKVFYASDHRVSGVCNDRIRLVAARDDVMLVAWGALAKPWSRNRALEVLGLIGRPVVCIGLTKDGYPLHPVREGYTPAPLPYESRP